MPVVLRTNHMVIQCIECCLFFIDELQSECIEWLHHSINNCPTTAGTERILWLFGAFSGVEPDSHVAEFVMKIVEVG